VVCSPFLLSVTYDDGFVAYLNGVEVARVNMEGGPLTHTTTASSTINPTTVDLDISAFAHLLIEGTNVVALQAANASLGSSDFTLISTLTGPRPVILARRV
jgi:hypothetical protein